MPCFYRASVLLLAAAFSTCAFAAGAVPTLLASPAASAGTELPGATIIAKVEERIITLADVLREMDDRVDGVRKMAANEKEFYQLMEELQNVTINELINKALVVHEFLKDGKRRIPASYVDEIIAHTVQSRFNGDRSKFLAWLLSKGWTPREHRKNVEEDLIYDIMRRQQGSGETVISPAKVEAFYNENKEKFRQEDAAHLRLITFSRAVGMDDAKLLARVQTVLARLKAGEKFDALARELTDVEAHRSKGGDLGWNRKSDLKPEFAALAFTLGKGEIGGPIVTPEAAYLILVEDRKAAGIQPLSDVSGEIQKILTDNLGRENEARWIARLRANAYIRVYLPSSPADAAPRPTP